MADHWPRYHAELRDLTTFDGIVSVPFAAGAEWTGAIDLYFDRDCPMGALAIHDAASVAAILSAMLAGSTDAVSTSWLDSPAAEVRFGTVIAIGMITIGLNTSTERALAVLRQYADAARRTLDDIADEVLSGQLPLTGLG